MNKDKRTLKNIVMIIIAVAMIAALVFTSGVVRLGGGNMPAQPNGQQSQMESGQQPPEMQSGQQPPEKPSENAEASKSNNTDSSKSDSSNSSSSKSSSSNSSSSKSDSSKSDSSKSDSSNSGNSNSGSSDFQPGQKPGGMGGMTVMKSVMIGLEGLILAMVIIYLIMSGFNRKKFAETFSDTKKKVIYIVLTVVVAGAVFAGASFLPMKLMGGPGGNGGPGQMPGTQTEQNDGSQNNNSQNNNSQNDNSQNTDTNNGEIQQQ